MSDRIRMVFEFSGKKKFKDLCENFLTLFLLEKFTEKEGWQRAPLMPEC
jgi:hypothetical protein